MKWNKALCFSATLFVGLLTVQTEGVSFVIGAFLSAIYLFLGLLDFGVKNEQP